MMSVTKSCLKKIKLIEEEVESDVKSTTVGANEQKYRNFLQNMKVHRLQSGTTLAELTEKTGTCHMTYNQGYRQGQTRTSGRCKRTGKH